MTETQPNGALESFDESKPTLQEALQPVIRATFNLLDAERQLLGVEWVQNHELLLRKLKRIEDALLDFYHILLNPGCLGKGNPSNDPACTSRRTGDCLDRLLKEMGEENAAQ